MLTSDLVRARVRSGVVEPRYVSPSNSDVRHETKGLIALHEAHVGASMGELEQAIGDHIGDSPRFMLQRGLSKLLLDRGKLEVVAPRDPGVVREAVFRWAAEKGPVAPGHGSRETIINAAAAELGLNAQDVDRALYADLKSSERLQSIETPEVSTLLHRYNLALAQAVLLRATRVRVELPQIPSKEARFLFRSLKFHRLMHRITRSKEGYRLELDGPLSLFKLTTRYGLGLALFLPTLCRFKGWKLSADVLWGKKREACEFILGADMELRSEVKEKGLWEGKEEKHFRAAFSAFDSPWKLRRCTQILTLPTNEVLIPDYTLTHQDGRTALLDILWFWRARDVERKLAQRLENGPGNLIVALATRLKADREDVALDDERVYPFKGVIVPKKLLEVADRVAIG